MKTYIWSIGILCLLLVGCAKEENLSDKTSSFKLYLKTPETKTINDGLSTKWVVGDQLLVQYAEAGTTNYISPGNGRFDITNAETGEATPKTEPTLDKTKGYDWYIFYKWSYKGQVQELKAKTLCCANEESEYVQEGNNSMAHLSGTLFPIYGIAKDIPGDQYPSVQMRHVASVLEVVLNNSSNKAFVVKSVEVSAPGKALIGLFTLDCTTIPPTITPATTFSKVLLTVSNGSSIEIGDSASFYVGTAPFTLDIEDPLMVKITVSNSESNGEQTFIYEAPSETRFESGKIRKLEISFNQIF